MKLKLCNEMKMKMKMSDLPLVIIYIPTFNLCNVLKRTIDSVCSQTYKNLEIIIVNNFPAYNADIYFKKILKFNA